MKQIRISKVKQGDFIMKKADSRKVFVRGEWVTNRDGGGADGKGRYSLQDTEDMNSETFLQKNALVFVGFTY